MAKEKIINIAVIAHVDAGKSTLVDAFLAQSGVFRENEEMLAQTMDSDDIERGSGITIYSKNCSVMHGDYKINIVDTPGHADFSSEVERIIKTVDTVILLVDSSEGPMPQTRFVLSKALEQNLNPILLINKIDKKDARIDEVVDEVYELFMDLDANDRQLDFPILYGIARQGIVVRDPAEAANVTVESDGSKVRKRAGGQDGLDIIPLFETIIEQCGAYPDRDEEPLQFQISSLAYDDYIGRLGIGRIDRGVIREGQQIAVAKPDGSSALRKVNQCFVYRGLKRVPVSEVRSGDICVISGVSDITIGDTVCDPEHVEALPSISIEDPTLSMNFIVNKSPFAGKEGKFVTTRHIKERLEKELEKNLALRVEMKEGTTDQWIVSGRGVLHLSVLIETMRREGYELQVGQPQVIYREINGEHCEPIEELTINVPEEFSSKMIDMVTRRKGDMISMEAADGRVNIEFEIPSRGIIGLRTNVLTASQGEAIMAHRFKNYQPFKGEMTRRTNGSMIAMDSGTAFAYAIDHLQDRGKFFISPQAQVYAGQVVGEHVHENDLVVNVTKAKQLTNVRASGTDEKAHIIPPVILSLEEALEYIKADEYVEVTPKSMRIRKIILDHLERKRANKTEE